MDLRRYWTHPEDLTSRRLVVLLKGLPPESMYQTAMRNLAEEEGIEQTSSTPGQHGAWSLNDHLIANCYDLLNMIVWQNANEGSKNPSKPPEPLARPGVKSNAVPKEIKEMFQAKRRERERLLEEERTAESESRGPTGS